MYKKLKFCNNLNGGIAMLNTLVRSLAVYFILIISVRLMGKREIGQLQPADLVITILISELAVMPIEETDIPFLQSISAIILLVGLEIVMSLVTLKMSKLRHLVQGNSLLVINEGKIDRKMLRKMRLTVDDLIAGLRLKDVFDISEVEYAYVETNGQLSVKLKKPKEPVKAEDMKIKSDDRGIPFVIISDGRLITESLEGCNMTKEELSEILKSRRLERKDILILAADKKGVTYIAEKKK